MSSAAQVKKFFDLMAGGKKAALDVNLTTGEVVCQFTKNETTGAEGVGTPGTPFTGAWDRVASCADGEIKAS